ncbi:RES domain-containing protein [Paraburkholderia phenoliruptrix]|uniref:RES domain-containing protein n=1 Tax=Paraburkholderia phenoliruptrix TaxID=252970 RepID=UPI0039B3BB03
MKRFVSEKGQVATCHYCGSDNASVAAQSLFDYIFERVKENFATENDLSQFEYDMLYEGGADDIAVASIDVVLSEWLNLGGDSYFDDLSAAVPSEFNTNERGYETYFYGDDGLLERNFYEKSWQDFVENIGHAHRFFNTTAREFLDSVFSLLVDEESVLRPECLRQINCGEHIFRARSVDGYTKAKQLVANPKEFGPAPRGKASNQRMTPSGISALYCASNRATCLSEIRSITGDEVVSVALTPTTGLILLDLTQLERLEPPKLTNLDVGYLKAMHLKTFLKSLVKKMSRPKSRTDDLSYLSTQVVFEYLRLRFVADVDGIIVPSVQSGEISTNVVLFPESSVISSTFAPAVNARSDFLRELKEEAAAGFEAGEKLAVVAGSFLFHKVIAIETKAETYGNIRGVYSGEWEQKHYGRAFARDIADVRESTEG